MKFVIQQEYSDRGVLAIYQSGYNWRKSQKPEIEDDEIPLGSVDWIEKILGKVIKPSYFPDFLKEHLYRKIWFTDTWPKTIRPLFIKPADKHKKWAAKIIYSSGYQNKKPGPYCVSEVVRFRNEYRYYIANGKILSGWWYWGDSNDKEQYQTHSLDTMKFIERGVNPPDAPLLPNSIVWPTNYCGAVDFGELWSDGRITLIEANAPFSCGWYGEQTNFADYCEFLQAGWKNLSCKTKIT